MFLTWFLFAFIKSNEKDKNKEFEKKNKL